MTALRILAPVSVDYHAVPGATLRDPKSYAQFWTERQPAVEALLARLSPDPGGPPPAVTLEHTRVTSSLNLYRTISDHASGRPLHVLTGSLRPQHLPDEFAGATDRLHLGVTEIGFSLYDHGLMLLELLVRVDPEVTASAEGVENRLDELQASALAMGEQVARETVRRYLDPLLELFRQADPDERILVAATPAGDPMTAEFGETLWVTRSLVLDPADPGATAALRHWVKDTGSGDSAADPAEPLLSGKADRLVRWLNYAFMDPAGAGGQAFPGERFRDSWDALRFAQVFYGALDRIDSRLSKILADSAASRSRWELGRLKEQLTSLSQRAELIIMERRDLAKVLKRRVRHEMDEILDYWEFEKLIEEPVRFKIETCDRRLAELAGRRAARSALFTDLILLGIGVTSILGTALALTQFGRTVANDPAMTIYDLGRSSMVEWVAAQPADAVLIGSGVTSALMVVLYLFFRRDRHS
ncbi:hypothetical protein [Allorhizocola rhizosphaerae]|uniref:hypothetical protein n=1 Tax=Allorhizocola rhizosphaerae TaxID=1872709 RepID=UPI000E3D13BC|nr:hypothetical protein [Allorhizocola rhizosphaerae]